MMTAFLALSGLFATADTPANMMTLALEYVHAFGKTEELVPGRDRALKIAIAEQIAAGKPLPRAAVREFVADEVFAQHADGAGTVSPARLQEVLIAATPKGREALPQKTRLHLALLSTQLDLIEEAHREGSHKLVDWLVKNYTPGKPLGVIVVCTGNTRRSMFGAAMGNLAASYHGLEVRFSSGGTAPDAFNPRTITALREIGVTIDPIGREAPRGSAGRENPIYIVRWGQGLEAQEFSKHYTDAGNPQDQYAAIVVCSEADASCPTVQGAAIRIPVKYLDPKLYDGAPFEAAKYAERRDDIGRFMLSTLMQARRQLVLNGKLK
jgi:arsenate reductase (thioredoxin)